MKFWTIIGFVLFGLGAFIDGEMGVKTLITGGFIVVIEKLNGLHDS